MSVDCKEQVYQITTNGIQFYLGTTESRYAELAGDDNPFVRPPRGKFEAMHRQLDLPYFIYMRFTAPVTDRYEVVARGQWITFDSQIELPMLVTSPDGEGLLVEAWEGRAVVQLFANRNQLYEYPVSEVNPLPLSFIEHSEFSPWLERIHKAKRRDYEVSEAEAYQEKGTGVLRKKRLGY